MNEAEWITEERGKILHFVQDDSGMDESAKEERSFTSFGMTAKWRRAAKAEKDGVKGVDYGWIVDKEHWDAGVV